MKIDKSVIDSKAMELTDDISKLAWDDIDSKITLSANLGYISGICELAKALKNMLEEDGGEQ